MSIEPTRTQVQQAVQRHALAREKWMRMLGLLPLTFFLVHAVGYHGYNGRFEDMLWVCHIANLLIAVGLLFSLPRLNAIGFLWLVIGNGLWVLDLATGGPFVFTSTLTHVGGILVAIMGLKTYGMPKGSWVLATFSYLPLLVLTRLITSPANNVNLAFQVYAGWEAYFPSHALYLFMLIAIATGVFALCEKIIHALV